MESKKYRWVQVITSILDNHRIIQLIGTTNSEDRTDGLDELIIRHRSQMDGATPVLSMICYKNSDGNMFHENIPLYS